MNNKTKIISTRKALLLVAAFFPLLAVAEVQLKDASEVVGTWTLESVAPSLTKAKIPENRTWVFGSNGVIVTSGFNRHFNREDTQQFNYSVVNGRISADIPGRPGKKEDFVVYEKNAESMTLQGGSEGFYFFKKK
jgi:hypothetical protein